MNYQASNPESLSETPERLSARDQDEKWFSSKETSLVPRPSYHGVPVRGPGNNGLRMRLIKTARYA